MKNKINYIHKKNYLIRKNCMLTEREYLILLKCSSTLHLSKFWICFLVEARSWWIEYLKTFPKGNMGAHSDNGNNINMIIFKRIQLLKSTIVLCGSRRGHWRAEENEMLSKLEPQAYSFRQFMMMDEWAYWMSPASRMACNLYIHLAVLIKQFR